MGSKDPDFKNPEAEAQWVAGQVMGDAFETFHGQPDRGLDMVEVRVPIGNKRLGQ